jgi:hypothetical protein
MQLVLKQLRELLHNLVSKDTKLLSSLVMLNNKVNNCQIREHKLLSYTN